MSAGDLHDETAPPVRASDAPLDQARLLGLVGYNCRRAYIPILSLFLARLEPLRLRPVDFSVLVLIAANDRVTQKRLSRALNVSPPNLAVLLDKLQARKLITRVPNPLDRRSQILHLTDHGRDVTGQAEVIVAGVELEATAGLDECERELLMKLLQRIFRPPSVAVGAIEEADDTDPAAGRSGK